MTIIVAGVCVYEGFLLLVEAKRTMSSKIAERETDMEADFLEPAAEVPSETETPESP
jgi:hypothetical protein